MFVPLNSLVHPSGAILQVIVPVALVNEVQALANKLNAEAETLEKASDEKARAALQKQFVEIDARVRLNQVKEAVVTALTRLGHQAKLALCLSAVKTNAISLKASELAEKVVSKELVEALNREFKALGVGTLRVSLQSRSDRGKALHKLKLELPQSRSPGDILSEGEGVFLHAFAEHPATIAFYRSLGFEVRAGMTYTIFD